MKVFADTNFFTNLWVELPQHANAQSLCDRLLESTLKLQVTRLLRLELTNALQRLIFEARHGVQNLTISREMASAVRGEFDDALEEGHFLQWCVIPEDHLEQMFDSLAYRFTATHGFRTYDILHVASALVLGCDTFWSFDDRAKKLAELVGLQVNG